MGEYGEITLRLLIALLFGGLVGLERSYHGRPAGFRTHALVCLGSAVLMLVTVYEGRWFVSQGTTGVTIDPTRMAQGIMTGIGFLGAGVIMREGLSVRGLTTAASIWVTAAIGVLVGIGFYFSAALAAALTLGTLAAFRWLERWMPTHSYAKFVLRFRHDAAISEPDLRLMVVGHGFSVANLSYCLVDEGRYFEYHMMIQTLDPDNLRKLSEDLRNAPNVVEFQIAPTGD